MTSMWVDALLKSTQGFDGFFVFTFSQAGGNSGTFFMDSPPSIFRRDTTPMNIALARGTGRAIGTKRFVCGGAV